jgi:hypothetical protein
VAQTIFQEEMDALVVTNQEPAREMMTEEMILTEAIVTTDVIVPIKYIFFKDKKKNLRDYYFWICLFCHTNNHEVKLTFSLGRNIKQKGVKKNIN